MSLILKSPLQERLTSVYRFSQEIQDITNDVTVSRAVYSDFNSQQLQQKMFNPRGQKIDVQLIWNTPDCRNAVSGIPANCTNSTEKYDQDSVTETIERSGSNTLYLDRLFDLSDYREMLAAADEISGINVPLTRSSLGSSLEGAIMELTAKVDLAADKKLVKFMVDTVDQTTYGFSPLEIDDIPDIATDKGKAVKSMGVVVGGVLNDIYTETKYSAKIAKYSNLTPTLIGGHLVSQFIALNQAQCCSSDGINLFDIYNQNRLPAIYSDHLIEYFASKYAGTGMKMNPYFLSYDPGSIQVINYAYNRGMFGLENSETLHESTFVSPYSGRTMDLIIYHDTCAKKVSVKVSLTEEFRVRPETQCDGTAAYNTNGLQQFKIINS
jgi:hypothetical protein